MHFLNKNVTNILVPKLFRFAKIFRFGISAPHFSVGETLRVTYFLLFPVNTKYVSSGELKTLDISLVLRTRVNAGVFNNSMKYIFGIHLKK